MKASLLIAVLCFGFSCASDPQPYDCSKYKTTDGSFIVWVYTNMDSIHVSYIAIMEKGAIINAGVDSTEFAGSFRIRKDHKYLVYLKDYRQDHWLKDEQYKFRVMLSFNADSIVWKIPNKVREPLPYVPLSAVLFKDRL